jgi:hypothetical protein
MSRRTVSAEVCAVRLHAAGSLSKKKRIHNPPQKRISVTQGHPPAPRKVDHQAFAAVFHDLFYTQMFFFTSSRKGRSLRGTTAAGVFAHRHLQDVFKYT